MIGIHMVVFSRTTGGVCRKLRIIELDSFARQIRAVLNLDGKMLPLRRPAKDAISSPGLLLQAVVCVLV